jgi:nitroimidazol reductase NimA-like FMN-containing flavoprotein (pyridoxamine 5'-phosphate oxidase superfamily)
MTGSAAERNEVDLDRNGLEVLDRGECLELLGSAAVGRIGLSSAALPLVLPVNFCVDGGRIVVRTGNGTTLASASDNAVVSFEADDIDPLFHAGWSVVVTGVARPVTDEDDVRHVMRLPLLPWGVRGEHFVAISIDHITGRRIRRPAPAPDGRPAWR